MVKLNIQKLLRRGLNGQPINICRVMYKSLKKSSNKSLFCHYSGINCFKRNASSKVIIRFYPGSKQLINFTGRVTKKTVKKTLKFKSKYKKLKLNKSSEHYGLEIKENFKCGGQLYNGFVTLTKGSEYGSYYEGSNNVKKIEPINIDSNQKMSKAVLFVEQGVMKKDDCTKISNLTKHVSKAELKFNAEIKNNIIDYQFVDFETVFKGKVLKINNIINVNKLKIKIDD